MGKLFGTNGIRGVVNKDMNSNLALDIGKAWGTLLKESLSRRAQVIIGTDARISNYMLKNAITSGFLSTGCNVVDAGLVPTPALQYVVKTKKFDSGVIITASHNPPQFNGIKGIADDGTEFMKETEDKIEEIYFNKKFSLVNWEEVGQLSIWDGAIQLYLEGILKSVDVNSIKRKKFHVVLDCGNGAGSLVTPKLLNKLNCRVTELYCIPDGRFPGHDSEPLPENLSELMKKVTDVNADFGVAQDGDADRAIFIDENGRYIWGDKSLALGAKNATKQKGGIVVTPVTTSSCLDDVVKENGGRVIRTAVGSPIVARVMISKKAVFGGEENGGLIFPEMQYCRDSAMSIAKILEILAKEKKKLSQLIDEIPKYEVFKTKIPCSNDKKKIVMSNLSQQMKKNFLKIDTTDGLKIYFNEGWVLVRPSGTEPIFRIYTESKDCETSHRLAMKFKKIIEKIINNA
jgi:phosphomannomutase/phosphoglucomutase